MTCSVCCCWGVCLQKLILFSFNCLFRALVQFSMPRPARGSKFKIRILLKLTLNIMSPTPQSTVTSKISRYQSSKAKSNKSSARAGHHWDPKSSGTIPHTGSQAGTAHAHSQENKVHHRQAEHTMTFVTTEHKHRQDVFPPIIDSKNSWPARCKSVPYTLKAGLRQQPMATHNESEWTRRKAKRRLY